MRACVLQRTAWTVSRFFLETLLCDASLTTDLEGRIQDMLPELGHVEPEILDAECECRVRASISDLI